MSVKKVIIWAIFALIDLSIGLLLGVLLMDYDDFYDASKGAYWSLESMTQFQKIIYILFLTWEILNIVGILYFVFRIIKKRS